MIINFLQTRDPPVLPALQQRQAQRLRTSEGVLSSFADDVKSLRGFGKVNKETIGELLFGFFRFYGHEIDFEHVVISVRVGKLITKKEKGWHLGSNNRLCVEEPFNTTRNLSNTADDTSFRGLHMELRRAFANAANADLELLCEQYEYPPEEERIWSRPPPQPRPILTQITPQTSRGGRGTARGARHSSNNYRGQQSSRRASSGSSGNRPDRLHNPNPGMPSREYLLQAQQAQHVLHDQLFQHYQFLQAQEAELRMALHHQALAQGRPPGQFVRASHPLLDPSRMQDAQARGDEQFQSNGGIPQAPMTAPLRPTVFPPYLQYMPVNMPPLQGTSTNPPSPLISPAIPDIRRSHRRTSLTDGSSGGALRAQSQPARSVPSPLTLPNRTATREQEGGAGQSPRRSRLSAREDVDKPSWSEHTVATPRQPVFDESRPQEYVGYYVGGSPTANPFFQSPHQQHMHPQVDHVSRGRSSFPVLDTSVRESIVSPISSMANGWSRPIPHHPSQARAKEESTRLRSQSANEPGGGPLIIDGSKPVADRQPSEHDANGRPAAFSETASTSDDHTYDTPATASDTFSLESQDSFSLDIVTTPLTAQQLYELHSQSDFNDKSALEVAGVPAKSETHVNGHRAEPIIVVPRSSTSEVPLVSDSPITENPLKQPPPLQNSLPQSTDLSPIWYRQEDTRDEVGPDGPFLSPVREVRTPSPTIQRQTNGFDQAKANGISHTKSKSNHQSRPSLLSGVVESKTIKDKSTETTPALTNGQLQPVHHRSGANRHNTWQQQTKKKNKNRKSSAEMQNTNAIGGEPLPTNESERKGG